MPASYFLVGAGGTGAKVVEALLRHVEKNPGLLLDEPTRRICALVVDVAMTEIEDVRKAHAALVDVLEANGAGEDQLARVEVLTCHLQTPDRENLAAFVHERTRREGGDDAVPFLVAPFEVTDLSGGVGRRRALSKTIFLHQLERYTEPRNSIERFCSRVSQMTTGRNVWVVYGVGGGSGSGVVLDLVRQMRAKLNTTTAIMGVGVLPCDGDDHVVFSAARSALVEHAAVLDLAKRNATVEVLGSDAKDSFSASFFLPLGPAYISSTETRPQKAWAETDDILVKAILSMNDADFTNNAPVLAREERPPGRWVATLNPLEVVVPFDAYFEAARAEVAALEALAEIALVRRPVFGAADATGSLATMLRLWEGVLEDGRNVLVSSRAARGAKAGTDPRWEAFLRRHKDEIQEETTRILTTRRRAFQDLAAGLERPLAAIRGADAGSPERGAICDAAAKVLVAIRDLPAGAAEFRATSRAALQRLQKHRESATGITRSEQTVLDDLPTTAAVSEQVIDAVTRVQRASIHSEGIAAELSGLKAAAAADKEKLERKAPQRDGLEEADHAAKVEEHHRRLRQVSAAIARYEDRIGRLAEWRDGLLPVLTPLLRAMLETSPSSGFFKQCFEAAELGGERTRKWADDLELLERRLQAEARDLAEKQEKTARRADRIPHVVGLRTWKAQRQKLHLEATAAVEAKRLEITTTGSRREEAVKLEEAMTGVAKLFATESEYIQALRRYDDNAAKARARWDEPKRGETYYRRVRDATQAERLGLVTLALRGALGLTDEALRPILDRPYHDAFVREALSRFASTRTLGLLKQYKDARILVGSPGTSLLYSTELSKELEGRLAQYAGPHGQATQAMALSPNGRFAVPFVLIASHASPDLLDVHPRAEADYALVTDLQRRQTHALGIEKGGWFGPDGFVPFERDAGWPPPDRNGTPVPVTKV